MPVSGEAAYLERLTLEAFQSGLSWPTILNKREAFREVFHGFDADAIAAFGARRRRAADGRAADRPQPAEDRGRDHQRPGDRGAARAGRAGGVRRCPSPRSAPPAPDDHRGDGDHLAGVGRAVEGAEEAGVRLRRPDDDVRADGGDRHRRRPPRGVPPSADVLLLLSSLCRHDARACVLRRRSSATSTPSAWPARSGRARCRCPRWSRRRSPAPSGSTPSSTRIAHAAFDRARAEAADPRGGFFAGVPTLPQGQRRRRRHAHPAGHRRLGAAAPARPTATSPGCTSPTGLLPARQDPAVGVRVQRVAPSTRGSGRSAARGTPTAPRARRRPGRRRWSPPGVVPIAHANDGGGSIRIPAAVNGLVGLKPTRDRLAQDKMMREMPVRIVSDGVLTRSVRDTAAFYREAEKVYRNLALPPIGDITRPGKARLDVAVVTEGIGRAGLARGADLTLKTAARLEELGHRVQHDRAAAARRLRRRLPALLVHARAGHGPHRPAHLRPHLGPQPARQPDPGPGEALRTATCTGCRWRSPGCAAAAGWSRAFFEQYDVVLTPTLADRDPAARPPRADPGLRHGHGAAARLGGLHAAAERHRRPGHQPAARDHRGRAAAGDDVRRRCGPRGHPPRARLRARGSRRPGPGSRTSARARGWTSSAWFDRATRPAGVEDVGRGHADRRRSTSVVSASSSSHSPSGGRSTCTVSSVFRNAQSRGSSTATRPDAESAQASSRWQRARSARRPPAVRAAASRRSPDPGRPPRP